MTMSGTGMNLDEFLGHSSRAKGGGRVLNWRGRDPSQIDTWMHTKSVIVALWTHGWPRIVEIERDGEKSVEVWGGKFNCWEQEDVLKRQYKRSDDGARQTPPQVCPICLLLEYLRGMVRAEKLSWTEPAFKFEGDDPDKSQVLTVGGLYNAFGGDDLTRQQIAELRRAGIRRDDAWKQNVMAKCSYVFSIVDNDEAEKGVQIAMETTSLGDSVKRVIRDQIEALGATEGHPLKNPYAIRWQYREKEQRFDEKYRALAMPKLAITPEIRDAIFDAPPPDLGPIVSRGNVASLRSVMEAKTLIELPFDRLFSAAEALEQAPSPAEPSPATKTSVSKAVPAALKADAPAPAPARRKAPPVKAEPVQPVYPAGTVTLPCDKCGATMAETDDTCWKCGQTYEMDAPEPAKAAVPIAKEKAAPAGKQAPAAKAVPAALDDSADGVDADGDGPWPGEEADGEVGF